LPIWPRDDRRADRSRTGTSDAERDQAGSFVPRDLEGRAIILDGKSPLSLPIRGFLEVFVVESPFEVGVEGRLISLAHHFQANTQLEAPERAPLRETLDDAQLGVVVQGLVVAFSDAHRISRGEKRDESFFVELLVVGRSVARKGACGLDHDVLSWRLLRVRIPLRVALFGEFVVVIFGTLGVSGACRRGARYGRGEGKQSTRQEGVLLCVSEHTHLSPRS
jgi:hypothetical protein